jgi:spore germination cell wall hydrolase CwlJ-like protein
METDKDERNFTNISSVDCLAKNIYFESRGESTLGKVAVAFVVLNRVKQSEWPSDICRVIFQENQFSWTSTDYLNEEIDLEAMTDSWLVASAVLSPESAINDPTYGATYFHSHHTRPEFLKNKILTRVIEGHKFYR